MFPHTITVFHHEIIDDKDIYTKRKIENVFWYGSDGISLSGNGLINSNLVNIDIPKKSLDGYGDDWCIYKKDIIVKGIADDIITIKDLKKYSDVITVDSISNYDVNSTLDNILITGK